MRAAHRAAMVAAVAACAPLPFDVSIAASSRIRPKIVALARNGVVHQVAILDLSDVDARALPWVPDARPEESIDVVVLTLDGALGTFGLAPGLHTASATGEETAAIGALARRTVSIEAATVTGDVLSGFQPVTLPAWLSGFRVPAKEPCVTLSMVAQPLPDLDNAATFVTTLADGRGLVGIRADAAQGALFIVDPTDPTARITVRLEPPPNEPTPAFYAVGALPLADVPAQVWLAMRSGELWRVELRDDGQPVAPLQRVPTGQMMGLGFVQGHASRGSVDLYGLAPDGPFIHYDGTSVEVLHDFPDGSYFGGGIAIDTDGTVFAARSSQAELVQVIGSRGVLIPLDGAREGLTGIASVPGVGLVVSDGRGQIYRRELDAFRRLTDVELGTGAQAIVPLTDAFFGAGASGSIREWRKDGGLCPAPTQLVGQTLRWWSPLGERTWLVSGPERDGATRLETPLTIMRIP